MSTDPDSQQEVSDSEASQQPDQDGKSIDEKSDGVVNPPAQEKQSSDASSELIVLSPHYDEKHHGLYVEKLEQAVRNPKVRNIALTGGYGTDKSSVIQGLIERIHSSKELKKIRPITISLPTIQIADDSDSGDNRTDRIQQEIVKQLLYQGNLRKMRNSRSRKIANITVFGEAVICFSFAGALTFFFWYLAKPDWHWHWSQGGSLWGYWQPAVVLIVLWVATLHILPLIYGIRVKELQFGPAKLELEKNGSDLSYFDQYFSNIIDYFETSGTNLVIFEDLDRFNNPYIFDALHELNELINISLRQKYFRIRKKPPVKFLYVTRDNVFGHETQEVIEKHTERHSRQLEIENRTKFFDIIVPIVPFSTSHNAYEHLTQLLNDNVFPIEIKIDRKLLEIVGSQVSDYRLLANIVSEFQIFTEQAFSSWGKNEEAVKFFKVYINHLFTFIDYKNTHLADYEKVQKGDSNIDQMSKEFLNISIAIHTGIKELFDNLEQALCNEIKEKFGPGCTLLIDGKPIYDYTKIQLWMDVIVHNNLPIVSLIDQLGNSVDDFDDCIFAEIFGSKIKGKAKNQNPKIQEVIKSISLINNSPDDFQLFFLIDELNLVFPDKIQEEIDKFTNLVESLFEDDEMVKELIKNRYITRNFPILASAFMGKINNAKTIIFLTEYVEKFNPNITFSLNEQEIEEIIYQIENHQNKYRSLMGALNIDLILYLLEKQVDQIEFRILDDYLKSQPTAEKPKELSELVNAILQKRNNQPDTTDKLRQFFRKIETKYPDIFQKFFEESLTANQKILYHLANSTSGNKEA